MMKTHSRILASLLAGVLMLSVYGAPAQHAQAQSSNQSQTWTINIKNADLNEFIAQVAEITGRTFVVDPRIKGNVTVVSSTPMTADAVYELFLSVLRVHNWTAVPAGGVMRIQQSATAKQSPGAMGSLNRLPSEELVTRVVAAQNVQSAELVKILRPLIPQYGHIAAVDNPNVVIISDHADNIVRMMQIIQQIDVSDEEEMVVVQLKHAYVTSLVDMLERVAPEQLGRGAAGPQRIQIIANARNNSLVVRGKPRPIAQVLRLIDTLDQPTTMMSGTQVIYLKYADATKVAELLEGVVRQSQAGEETGPGRDTLIRADQSLNAIVVRGDPGVMREITEILERLDIRRTQVLIEAAIVEVSVSKGKRVGVEIAGADQGGNTTPLFSTTLDGIVSSLLGDIIGPGGTIDVLSGLAGITSPTLAAARIDAGGFSFAALVRAIATNSDANLLSTPSILTLDNQEARIVVGNEVPFRTGTFTTTGDGTTNPFTTIVRQDVGLQLTVTPQVHDGMAVSMQVDLEITNVLPSPIGEGAFSDVVTSKRTVQNSILADDGQTIVLGGLIQDDINDSVRKVPVLGDVPVVKHLFRSTSKDRTKRNLLVFLRPTIIRDKAEADGMTSRKYDDIWNVEIRSAGADLQPEELFRGRP
jgi:general secretion pathway protein D